MAPKTLEEILQTGFRPVDDEDWETLIRVANHVFRPQAPIDQNNLFCGRLPEVDKLLSVIYRRGSHAILFGERGVGKTSLANIICERVLNPIGTKTLRVPCCATDDFTTIWSNVFFGYTWQGKEIPEIIRDNPRPFTIHKIAESLSTNTNEWHVIVIDEFDRLQNEDAKSLLADTIKYFSDNPTKVTILVVGVASSLGTLFGNHPSIQRCCTEIRMPRMNAAELGQILTTHLPRLHMTATQPATAKMIQFAQGLPGYMHLLGLLSAQVALECRTLEVEVGHVDVAKRRALDAADETTKRDYYRAIQSTKPDNRYRQVLLACAMATKNELGQFSASDVCEPYSEIMGRAMGVPYFAKHLNAFCSPDRGPALIKSGTPKNYVYQFENAMLEPLVIMQGDRDPSR